MTGRDAIRDVVQIKIYRNCVAAGDRGGSFMAIAVTQIKHAIGDPSAGPVRMYVV